ncbi:MAG: glutathione S-transferase N-terminal domain-containing protein [Betaproteobacteria bacterium]|jgi:glutathione S-transferase|nr:glutathione S-transferase N-terminal domain-containing protein [Betaproteobacteria bacterium]MDH5287282.1 glutathione S-transferase N-terminal domain-containing protein [Betaproteobacteria bacterium]
MAEYVLHCFAQSGNAYKPALLLELAGADWAPRFVDYFGGETRTPAYRAINVMGEVPVLEHGGLKLAQSGVILDYLAQRFAQFGARGEDERREVLRWLLWDNHKLTGYTATLRFLRTFASSPEPAVVAEFGRRARAAWDVLEAHLDARAFVVGERPTVADLSLCGYLFWEEELGIHWRDSHPAIAAWLGRIRALPRWRAPYELMPGHPRLAA